MNAESTTHHGRHALPDHLHLEVGTVSGLIFSGVVYEVNLPGSAGGMGVLPGHVPVLTTLDAGMLSYRTSADAEPAALYVVGGLAEVGPGYVHVLADHAVHSEEADAVRRAEALHRAEAQHVPEPRPADFKGIKAALDQELLRFFQMVLFGRKP